MFNVIELQDNESYFNSNLKVCRPNRQVLYNLKEAFNKKLKVKLGNVNELSFDIPYYINRNHKILVNPLVENLRLGYLIRLDFKGKIEYFLVNSDSKSYRDDGQTVSFTLQSLSYKLGRFDVYQLITDTENLSTTMVTLLNESDSRWKLGTVDSSFDLLFRSVNIQASTILESIFTISQTFGAIPEFDTVNKVVNFRTLESTGTDKGFQAKEGKFLESYELNSNLDEIVTRLKCYGKDGLEFRSLTSTGSNYIQDFSYFIYPFELDENDNIINHSKYMSDELCMALIRYERLSNEVNGEFNQLVQLRTEARENLTRAEQTRSNLQTERRTVENELDLINLTYGENARNRNDWLTTNNSLTSVLNRIIANNNEIEGYNSEIELLNSQIQVLGTRLDVNSNFSVAELDELSEYIYTKEYTDENIISEEDLLNAGREVFNKYREPKLTLNFSLVSFLNDFRYRTDRRKVILGDIITFNSKKFNNKIKARIIEIEYDLDTLDTVITISNDISKLTDEELLIDLLNYNNSLNRNLEKNLYKLDLGQSAQQEVTRLLNTAFDTGRTILTGGYNNTNEMTQRGFYSRSFQNPENDFLVINGGGMYITRDGARSVEVAIDSSGVHANRIIGRFILSNRLQIDSNSGIITIADNTLTIKDNLNNNRVILGRYSDPSNTSQFKYGLYVLDGSFDLRTSTNANTGIQLDANGIRAFNSNGARVFEIDSAFGDLYFSGTINSSTINGGIIQTTTEVNRGIKITDTGLSGYNNTGLRTVFLDINGNLTVNNGTFTGNITGSNITGGNISGTNISGANITGGNISVETDVRVGRILRVGTFVNETQDSAALVFGGDEIVDTAAYIRATYVFNNTALTINAQAGIDIRTFASINLRSSRIENYGRTYINGTGTDNGTLGIISADNNSGAFVEFYRSSSFNNRIGYMGYGDSTNILTIQNNTGSRVAIITTGTVFRINTDGVSVRNRAEDGYLPIAASAFTQNSRREDKKNIELFNCELNMTALQKINSTNVYKYHYNNELDTDLKHTGLILDEVPLEMVDPKGVGVDIYGMASILWKAVQELTQELNDLKNNN